MITEKIMPPKKPRGISVANQIALKFNCGFARVAAYELFVNKRYVKSKKSKIAREVNHVKATMQCITRAPEKRFSRLY